MGQIVEAKIQVSPQNCEEFLEIIMDGTMTLIEGRKSRGILRGLKG